MPDTATPLGVPNDALALAHAVALDSRRRRLDISQMSARIMHEAGPMLVAAELRRLANSSAGYGPNAATLLRARADELDPPR